MRYVVMDLEWNNTYCKKLCGFINEIIEIGAVMLDEDLNTIDTFSAIIKAQIGKKLQGRVKKLTNLTNEDIYSGDTFQSVMHNFGQWMGDEPAVILTWADGDIRTLLSNYRYYYDATIMPFCGMYADLQKYCQSFLDIPKSQQVGLSAAAELLGIDPSAYPHHRALDDSILSADCLRQVYEKEKLMSYAKECDIDFYKRLEYKPHVISNIDNPRTPRGVRHLYHRQKRRQIKFQSTHPTRGATLKALIPALSEEISIHAPHAGCDPNIFHACIFCK